MKSRPLSRDHDDSDEAPPGVRYVNETQKGAVSGVSLMLNYAGDAN